MNDNLNFLKKDIKKTVTISGIILILLTIITVYLQFFQ